MFSKTMVNLLVSIFFSNFYFNVDSSGLVENCTNCLYKSGWKIKKTKIYTSEKHWNDSEHKDYLIYINSCSKNRHSKRKQERTWGEEKHWAARHTSLFCIPSLEMPRHGPPPISCFYITGFHRLLHINIICRGPTTKGFLVLSHAVYVPQFTTFSETRAYNLPSSHITGKYQQGWSIKNWQILGKKRKNCQMWSSSVDFA